VVVFYRNQTKNCLTLIRVDQGWGQFKRIGIDQFNSNSIPELERVLEFTFLIELKDLELNWN